MTEAEKIAAEAAAKAAEEAGGKTAEEIAAEEAAKAAKEKDAPTDPNKVDYEAGIKKLKDRLGKSDHNVEEERAKRLSAEAATKTAEEKAEKLAEDAKKLAEESGKSIEEAKEELRAENRKELDSMRGDLLKDVVTEELDALTDNEEEKELIKLIYEEKIADKGTNRVTVREALLDARILANKPRFENAIKEVNAANKSKNSLGSGGAANADNANFEAGDHEAEKIESEMGGDLPKGFK